MKPNGPSALPGAVRSSLRRLRSGVRGRAFVTRSSSFEKLVGSGRVTVGRETYGVPTVHVHTGDTGTVSIGSFVSIADDVEIFVGGNHRTDWISTYPFRIRWDLPGAGADGHPASKGNVVIGSDVWLARGAKIMSGVEIGDGAVIAAYSVVTRNVRPFSIVAGSPAREVRLRFSDEQVEALQDIAWWDWPNARIQRWISLLSSTRVDEFIEKAGSGDQVGYNLVADQSADGPRESI